MKILGINFTKLNAEKSSIDPKGVKIGTHIDLSEIREVKSDFFSSKERILGIKFNKVLEGWKEKNLPDDFRLSIFNLILKKSSLKALQLEEELNIPLHIAMPFLKPQDASQDPKQTQSSLKQDK